MLSPNNKIKAFEILFRKFNQKGIAVATGLRYLCIISATLIWSIPFQGCHSESDSELPVQEETYVFPFKTEVDALGIYYPPGVDREIYIEAEKWSDEIKRDIVEVIPPHSNARLIQMGNEIHRDYFAGLVTDHAKLAWAAEILENMKPHLVENQYPYHLYAIQEDNFNAFTIPGGNIYLTTTVLDAVQNKDQLAFIIGHELGHNENDHTREGGRLITYGEKLESELGHLGSLAWLVTEILGRFCGKSDELECDIASLYLLHRAGYDPEKALEGVALLQKFSTPKPDDLWTQLMWIVMGSHPWSEDRYAIVSSYIKQAKVNTTCEEVFTNRSGVVITKYDPLTLRAYPLKHLSGEKIPKGATIQVLCDCVEQEYQKNRDWLYVKYTDQDSVYYGWVDKQYVQF